MTDTHHPDPFGNVPDMTEFEKEWDEQREYFQAHHAAELRGDAKVCALFGGSLAVTSSAMLEVSSVLPETPGYLWLAKTVIFISGMSGLSYSASIMKEGIHNLRKSRLGHSAPF